MSHLSRYPHRLLKVLKVGLDWYEDHEVPVPELRKRVTACAAYGNFHENYAGRGTVIDISHRFSRWVHTLVYSHCQASDQPHVGHMGRGSAASMAINIFHGACIKVPYLTSGPVAHATGLVGAWTTMLNCFQFLLVMHRGGSYHLPKALATKHHLATHLPDDIEGLESVV